MRAPPRQGGFLSSKAAKVLIGLPLLLAGFALTLQWSGPRGNDAAHLTLPTGRLPGEQQDYASRTQGQRLLISTADGVQAAVQPQADKKDALAVGSRKGDDSWRPGADWRPGSFRNAIGAKVAFVSTTAEGYKQTKLWVNYHRVIGVTHFYLFVDGQAARPEVMAQLQKLPGVKVFPRDEKLKEKQAKSRIWNETWLSAFFHKPCNHELFVLQSLNMEEAIQMAFKDGVDWILHIDTDELVYPGGAPEFSLQRILMDVPADVDNIVFPNYESLPERDDIKTPFTEVTLFKRNYHHVVPDSYFKSYHAVARGNPNYFITYGNGKSAARVQEGLRPNGAHRWYSYTKAPKEETLDQAAVLHYTYNRFSDLKSRRDRCDCAPTEEDAKRCFILPFDRMAFLAASMKSDEELEKWFQERLVWNDPAVVIDLLKSGLFIRAYEPQVLMRGFANEELSEAEQRAEMQAYPAPGQAVAGNDQPMLQTQTSSS